MYKIKICGLYRPCDIDYVNQCFPDYVGFILGFEKSHRNIDLNMLKTLTAKLDENILKVGVFVNAETSFILEHGKFLDIIQLHGDESNDFIENLRKKIPNHKIWKAFKIKSQEDLQKALQSMADNIVLDNGYGTGQTFDWSLLQSIDREFILAGGINVENAENAIKILKPYALDVSSGVETDKKKDFLKIEQIMKIVRSIK